MWSICMSEALVHSPPSYGLTHVPDSAWQASFVSTSVPSRLSTNSRVLQAPETVAQVGKSFLL